MYFGNLKTLKYVFANLIGQNQISQQEKVEIFNFETQCDMTFHIDTVIINSKKKIVFNRVQNFDTTNIRTMMKALLFTLLTVSAFAAECNIDCKANCAAFRAEKPRPRIYNACITGCESGKKGQCSACNSVPKPHPRTNKICGKACKTAGTQLRKCNRAKRGEAQAAVETVVIEQVAPSETIIEEVAAVAAAARAEQKALDSEIAAKAAAAAASAAEAEANAKAAETAAAAKAAADAKAAAEEETKKAQREAREAAAAAAAAAEAEAQAEAAAAQAEAQREAEAAAAMAAVEAAQAEQL
jgi:hypothetical protein